VRSGVLGGDLEISIDEQTFLEPSLDVALAVIVQNFMSRVVFIDRIRVFRGDDF